MPNNSQIVDVMPMDGGYITYLRPQLLPDSGFQTCEDALIYRGRLVKRDGYSLLGYLGPLTVAEVVGVLGSTSYAHNYALFPVIPNTVTATDTVVVLNDNGNGGYWQPGINVTGITQANPGVVTAVAHGYTTGDTVNFFNVGGMNAINSLPKEYFNPFTITVINANTFSIGVDTTAYGAYVAGGTAQQSKPGQRVTYRKVIDFGGLPSAFGSKSVAHGISTGANFTITKLQAFASDTTGFNYVPIPYASNFVNDIIELRMNATNITIAVAANKSAFTTCYVIVEYLKN